MLFAVFSFLATAAVARRLGLPLRGAAFAALAYAGIHEIFPVRAMTAGNDHTLSFFTLAAVDASLALARRPRARTAVVAGSALGLVLATKYVGVLFAPVLLAVLLLLWLAERRRSDETTPSAPQRWLPSLGVLLACAFVAAGYTYLRNWMTAGNPIFPAPVRIFGAQIFPGRVGILASERASSPEAQIVVWRFLTRNPEFFGFYFPFTLLPAAVLAPLAALARRRWQHLLVFLLPTVFFLEFLYLMPDHRGNRYFLPGIALAAVALAWLVSRPNPQAFLLRAAVLLWISWQTIWQCEWTTTEKTVTLVAALAGGALLELLWRKWRARASAAASGSRLELWKPIAVAGALAVAALTLGKVVATYQESKLDDRPAALALERLAGPQGSRIAYTGLNAPYLFFGSHLQNQVEIVPRTPDLESRTYRWGGPLAMPYEVKRYRRWRTNLERLGIDFVVVQRTPWEDPERHWIVRRPGEFRLEYADPQTEIWRVLPAGGPAAREADHRTQGRRHPGPERSAG
jgi:4-amino-4-deoxy-L-arabinose transferase-like glycosyltransferase